MHVNCLLLLFVLEKLIVENDLSVPLHYLWPGIFHLSESNFSFVKKKVWLTDNQKN
jgi:hypothetical protein